jgi:hypothetical protein
MPITRRTTWLPAVQISGVASAFGDVFGDDRTIRSAMDGRLGAWGRARIARTLFGSAFQRLLAPPAPVDSTAVCGALQPGEVKQAEFRAVLRKGGQGSWGVLAQYAGKLA